MCNAAITTITRMKTAHGERHGDQEEEEEEWWETVDEAVDVCGRGVLKLKEFVE